MQIQQLIFLILSLSLISTQVTGLCSGYTGYIQECQNISENLLDLLGDSTEVNSATTCQFLVQSSNETCNDFCTSQGKFCQSGYQNIPGTCDLSETLNELDNGCNVLRGEQICVCSNSLLPDDILDNLDPQQDSEVSAAGNPAGGTRIRAPIKKNP